MAFVKPKKSLGQHFLKNEAVAKRIADSLLLAEPTPVLEIGPGMGVLTKHLKERPEIQLKVIEIDTESVTYLKENKILPEKDIIEGDFLRLPLDTMYPGKFCITGNYPYNISSQILFKVYHHREQVPQLTGMFQREVARRVCSGPHSKEYGILSVLLQAYYTVEYLFTVDENEFNPPPKVKSGVLRMTRNEVQDIGCDEKLFLRVIKAGFNQRRKTLRNSMKAIVGSEPIDIDLLSQRPEQLSVAEFVRLTNAVEEVLSRQNPGLQILPESEDDHILDS